MKRQFSASGVGPAKHWTLFPASTAGVSAIRLFAASIFAAAALAGCGSPGAPAPPSLNLPTPVQDLAAARAGDSVRLTWTMPTNTTDHVPLKHPIRAVVCRKLESATCTVIGNLTFDPGKNGSYTDRLSGDLAHGPARLLSYQVTLPNRAQKSAGASNSAISAAGEAPPPVAGLTGQVRQDGVLLSWHPATTVLPPSSQVSIVYSIQRVLVGPAAAGSKTPATVSLQVHVPGDADPGHALDTSALLNQQYRYTVRRVAGLTLSGRQIEIQGEPSEPLTIATADIFPPAVPRGLAAVADAAAGAIDLSWSPGTEADLAGYSLFRRDLESGLPAQRLPPTAGPIRTPSFRDTAVERGHTYAYSVSAIDQNGNESARSGEVTETLPSQ
ncbi:MAG TPA: hypothetical protein VGR96_16890 [Acidobacteriaceae bacterium]|nr:hypothetical protein [Acidobacteriaceae bacterium]